MSQFRVITAPGKHHFTKGETVTLIPAGDQEYDTLKLLAQIFGVQDDAKVQQAKMYRNSEGYAQVLDADDIEEITPATLH